MPMASITRSFNPCVLILLRLHDHFLDTLLTRLDPDLSGQTVDLIWAVINSVDLLG